jgi:hypothetical protein
MARICEEGWCVKMDGFKELESRLKGVGGGLPMRKVD